MRIELLKKLNKIFIYFISWLGFTVGCNQPEMYGTPQAEFKLSGTVKSHQTGKEIRGIKVSIGYDVDTTGISGKYSLDFITFPDLRYQISFSDIDSTKDGHFLDKDISISFPENGFKGGDGEWNKGTNEQIFDVYLDEKNSYEK